MKTPDEIKKGLEPCRDKSDCEWCEFAQLCDLEKEALAYIQQLEADLEIAKIQNQYISEVADAYEKDIEKLERERDAAVNEIDRYCQTCNKKNCIGCKYASRWEWRGLPEV